MLVAFQAAGWVREIDDPLPETDDVLPEERLRETVKRLQRSIEPGTIRFGVTGGGRRAYWRPVAGAPPEGGNDEPAQARRPADG